MRNVQGMDFMDWYSLAGFAFGVLAVLALLVRAVLDAFGYWR
jgi:hypothetical protein